MKFINANELHRKSGSARYLLFDVRQKCFWR